MAEEMVRCEIDEAIATVTLNCPEKRNALSTEMMNTLMATLERIADDRSAHVVLLRAAGPVFSSGHDLNELRGQEREDYQAIFDLCSELMEALRLLPQPTVAEVGGLATAAGCQLVATCDMAIASENATFCTPGMKGGFFCTTPGVALARAVGTKKAIEMLLTAKTISAEEAERAGLVNQVVPADALASTAHALAAQIAGGSAKTATMGKAAFYRQIEMNRRDAYAYASRVMVANLMTPDAQEGVESFFSKRPPKFNA